MIRVLLCEENLERFLDIEGEYYVVVWPPSTQPTVPNLHVIEVLLSGIIHTILYLKRHISRQAQVMRVVLGFAFSIWGKGK